MSKKSYTESIKKIHDEWKRNYPSFVERRNNEQLASNKLDSRSSLGYHRSQGQARDGQAIDICGGPLMGPRNSAAEILQVEQHKYPGDRSSRNCRVMVQPEEPTSNKQSTSEQTLKHSGPRYASNRRASKTIPQ